jgi:soluble lytic murein transglycosylase-like protein
MSVSRTVISKKVILGCLALFVLGAAGYYAVALVTTTADSFSHATKITASNLAVDEGVVDSPQGPPSSEHGIALSLSSARPAAPPDMAGRKRVHTVRSESYEKLAALIKKYAALSCVDEKLVWAMIRRESGFNPGAVSPKGAMGLMQLMPGTAAMLGVKDAFDIEQNIQGGIKYLEMCLTRFDQDVGLALAAYNAGPGNVDKYQGCPPFPETINYVEAVLRDYGAGELRRGLKIIASKIIAGKTLGVEETATPVVPSGLLWRVPIPRWRVPAPQVKIPQPAWKVSRPLVMSSYQ